MYNTCTTKQVKMLGIQCLLVLLIFFEQNACMFMSILFRRAGGNTDASIDLICFQDFIQYTIECTIHSICTQYRVYCCKIYTSRK